MSETSLVYELLNGEHVAFWMHQVTQDGAEGVIAVNYWYDLDYQSILYPTVSHLRRLVANVLDDQEDLGESDDED